MLEKPATGGNCSVLLADDDPMFRKLLIFWLEKWNIPTTVVTDGVAAWEILQRADAPRLLLLDWLMPGIDGAELCRRIRGRKVQEYPYIVLLTASGSKARLIEGLNAGADDYLSKPFDLDELQARLRVGMRLLGLQDALLRKEHELLYAASHDSLTGLWNRGAILEFLEREVERQQRTSQGLGVLMLDVDRFKKINDTCGHAVGDDVLRELSGRLAGSMRQYDWIGRYGGEEFLAAVTPCDHESLTRISERLRSVIDQKPVRTRAGELHVTISIGAAIAPMGISAGCDSLIHTADLALYRAKNAGRNRIETTIVEGPAGILGDGHASSDQCELAPFSPLT